MSMDTSNIISVDQFCVYYKIETTFIHNLGKHGLLELKQYNAEYYIDYGDLATLEKYIHLHYELDINIEGLEAIAHLLDRVKDLQQEVRTLRHIQDPRITDDL